MAWRVPRPLLLHVAAAGLCVLLSLRGDVVVALGYDIPGLDGDFDLGVGGYEDAIGPGEDFGDYEDKYGTPGASRGGEEGEEDEGDGRWGKGKSDDDVDSMSSQIRGVLDLDDVTFEKINVGTRRLLVVFYAPWDKGCNEILPIMDDLASSFLTDKTTLLAKVNVGQHLELAARFEISTDSHKRIYKWPHFMLFNSEYPSGHHYEGDIGTQELIDFALDVGKAGVVDSFIVRVYEFMGASNEPARQSILSQLEAEISALTPEQQQSAGYYKSVMTTILKKGEGYLRKESQRLSGIIKAGRLAPEKLLNFRSRLNVLRVFATASSHDEL